MISLVMSVIVLIVTRAHAYLAGFFHIIQESPVSNVRLNTEVNFQSWSIRDLLSSVQYVRIQLKRMEDVTRCIVKGVERVGVGSVVLKESIMITLIQSLQTLVLVCYGRGLM